MAKKKSTAKHKPKGESGWREFWHFVALPPVRRLILIVVIIGVLYWQWGNILLVAGKTFDLFGWGFIFLIATFVTLVTVIWRRKVLASIYHWNQWIGSFIFTLAAWGVISFWKLGGSFGEAIIGTSVFLGALRLLGMAVLGFALVAPGLSLRLVVRFFGWAREQSKKRPAPRPVSYIEPTVEEPAPQVTIAQQPPAKEVEAAPPALTPASALQELKQVAQEVWKKYGESPSLVTVEGWRLPPIDILDTTPEVEFGQADNLQRAKLIEEALASYGVEAKVVQINAGPTVTQFGVEPGWERKRKEVRERDKDGNIKIKMEEVSKTRVKVEKITSLANDLALALAAPSIRIEAPVPGKSMVGIEVPNTVLGLVSLRGVIETNVFQKLKSRSKLTLALGKGAGGEAAAADLSRMPHLLIAGATGSGKTVCLNSTICCLLVHNIPNDVKFIMIDPKRVELTVFNGIPHLATPVIVDTQKAIGILRWLNQEMDKRYQQLATVGARNIESYNKNKNGEERLPYLVLIIDELADLMMAGFDEVEHTLCRLAQLARAVGIHLIVATQRPSVDVVTGLIKANFPTRISFAVTSQVDSRTILDMGGAEKLLGRGDMLYMPTEAAKPKRLQGCYVSDAERERLVYFWSSQRREERAMLGLEELVPSSTGGGEYPKDPLLDVARQLAKEHNYISTSFLQRKLHIGYPRAARIMEQLEEEGIKRAEGEV
jgi:S-DNA-T family DNA segregation ATPase FtsK/SpoIIIE